MEEKKTSDASALNSNSQKLDKKKRIFMKIPLFHLNAL